MFSSFWNDERVEDDPLLVKEEVIVPSSDSQSINYEYTELTTPGLLFGKEFSKKAYDTTPNTCKKAYIQKIQFGLLSPEMMCNWVQIHKGTIYEKRVPCTGGVNDARMGTTPRTMRCRTCNENNEQCIGHFGYIKLAKPVYNIEFFKVALKILTCVCFFCSRLLAHSQKEKLQAVLHAHTDAARLKAVHALSVTIDQCGGTGMLLPSKDIEPVFNMETYRETGCFALQPQYTSPALMEVDAIFPNNTSLHLSTEQVYAILDGISDSDAVALGFEPPIAHPRNLMFRLLPVPPPSIRPSRECAENDGTHGHDDATLKLQRIIKINEQLEKAVNRELAAGANTVLTATLDMNAKSNNDKVSRRAKRQKAIQDRFRAERDATMRSKNENESELEQEVIRRFLNSGRMTLSSSSMEANPTHSTNNSNNNKRVRRRKKNELPTVQELLWNLQYEIATYINNETPGLKPSLQKSGKPTRSFRSRLLGKGGRVRKNLTGKRTDYSGRTVIANDPNLMPGDIGISEYAARILTVEEEVTVYNIKRLLEHVRNGPFRVNGAMSIRKRDGGVECDLRFGNNNLIQLEIGDFVARHLVDGDYVLINRQPSLHRMSIMCHRVRIYVGMKVMFLAESVTSAYNADFDGDEMNVTIPRNEMARAEARSLMLVQRQILSPKTGMPCFGLVQDSILGAFRLTERSCFFPRDDVITCLHVPSAAVSFRDKDGTEYVTGGDVLSTCFSSEMFYNSSDIPLDRSGSLHECMNQISSKIAIANGRWLHGTLNKSSLNQLVRAVVKKKGFAWTEKFIFETQKLCVNAVTKLGTTVGVRDCANPCLSTCQKWMDRVKEWTMTTSPTEEQVDQVIESLQNEMSEAALKALESQRKSESRRNGPLDIANRANAKGSSINIIQLSVTVGQTLLDRRSGDSLPHYGGTLLSACQSTGGFRSLDKYRLRKQGFIEHPFSVGLDPDEWQMHSSGGRVGLTDTAVKTSETGYLERRFSKTMETLMVSSDRSVRGLDGRMYQSLYGGDGLDGCFTEEDQFRALEMDEASFERKYKHDTNTVLDQEFANLMRNREWIRADRLKYQWSHLSSFHNRMDSPLSFRLLQSQAKFQFRLYRRTANTLSPEEAYFMVTNCFVIIQRERLLRRNAGFVTTIEVLFWDWFASKPLVNELHVTREALNWMLNEFMNALARALVQPYEMVGAVSAQSVGETNTQFTLNTFKLAGSKHTIALGLPQLQEIVKNTLGDKMAAPAMMIFLKHKESVPDTLFPDARTFAVHVARNLSKTMLKDAILDFWVELYDASTRNGEDLLCFSELWNCRESSELSDWCIRLQLDKAFCMSRLLYPSRIVDMIQTQMFRGIHHIWSYSAVHEPEWFIQFRMDESSPHFQKWKKKQVAKYTEIGASHFYYIVAQRFMHDVQIHGIYGIHHAFANEIKVFDIDPVSKAIVPRTEWVVETEGTNLQAVLQLPEVDQSRTITNDTQAMFEVLGIGAAKLSIQERIQQVMSFNNMHVGSRHLKLLAAVMTQSGRVLSYTRHGILKTNASFLAKCSFETTANILESAAQHALVDPLVGVTESGMVGNVVNMGSGVPVLRTESLDTVTTQVERDLMCKRNLQSIARIPYTHSQSLPLDRWVQPSVGNDPRVYQPTASFRALVSTSFLSDGRMPYAHLNRRLGLLTPQRITFINGVHVGRYISPQQQEENGEFVTSVSMDEKVKEEEEGRSVPTVSTIETETPFVCVPRTVISFEPRSPVWPEGTNFDFIMDAWSHGQSSAQWCMSCKRIQCRHGVTECADCVKTNRQKRRKQVREWSWLGASLDALVPVAGVVPELPKRHFVTLIETVQQPYSPTYSPTLPMLNSVNEEQVYQSWNPASPSYNPTSPSYKPSSPSYVPTSPSYNPANAGYDPEWPA